MFARLSLALLLLPAVVRADDPPPVPPLPGSSRDVFTPDPAGDGKYPLPQDANRQKVVREAARKRARAMTVDLFEKHGDTQGPEAADVRAFQEAAAAALAASPVVRQAARDAATKKLAKIALFTSDPVARAYFLDSQPVGPNDAVERAGEWKGLLDGMAAAKYPPARRLHAARMRAWELGRVGVADAKAAEVEFWKLCMDTVKGGDADAVYWVLEEAEAAMADAAREKKDRAAVHTKAAASLKEANAPAWVRQYLDGRFHVAHAWDARGAAAGNVAPAARATFEERLKKAETALVAAYTADPNQPGPAGLMILVCTGLKRDRETMEMWFKRAMDADPDDAAACVRKAEYLSPKWHGTADEVMAFGYQCARTKNFAAGLPLVLFKAHESDKKWANYEKYAEYYNNPRVRDDLRQVLEGHLKAHPEDRQVRSQLFCLCIVWKEPKPAAGHLKLLGGFGNDVTNWTGGAAFNEFKEALKEMQGDDK